MIDELETRAAQAFLFPDKPEGLFVSGRFGWIKPVSAPDPPFVTDFDFWFVSLAASVLGQSDETVPGVEQLFS